jgi:hypothetical protein
MPLVRINDKTAGDAEISFRMIFDPNAACMVGFKTSIIFETIAASRNVAFFLNKIVNVFGYYLPETNGI